MSEELKKAVEEIRRDFPRGRDKNYDIILKIAQDYLSCGELEEKTDEYVGEFMIDTVERLFAFHRGFNAAVHQHKLIMLRKQEELEEKCKGMEEIIVEVMFCSNEIGNEVSYAKSEIIETLSQKISTALTNYLMRKGEKQ